MTQKNLIFQNEIPNNVTFELYDMLGRRLSINNRIITDRRMTLDISPFPPGVYHLILSKDGEAYKTISVVFIN